jgi:hypothetical protein
MTVCAFFAIEGGTEKPLLGKTIRHLRFAPYDCTVANFPTKCRFGRVDFNRDLRTSCFSCRAGCEVPEQSL